MPLALREVYNAVGEEKLLEMCEKFYDRVYADEEEPWFSNMFREANAKPAATHLLASFVVQKCGGPKMYGGMLMESVHIIDIHKHFPVTPRGAELWVQHMESTLKDVDFGERDAEAKETLLQWFRSFGKTVTNTTGAAAEEYHRAHPPAHAAHSQ